MKWDDIFKLLKEKTVGQGYYIWPNCPSKNEGEIKTFPDEQKLRELITTRTALEEMLKRLLQVEIKGFQVKHEN